MLLFILYIIIYGIYNINSLGRRQYIKLFEAADIIIYIKGKGIVLKEKSLVAYNTVSGRIIAFGEAALPMAENPSDNIKVISPLRRGMVADYIAAMKLFTYLLSEAWERKPLCKVPVAICVPKGITEVEKRR